MVLNIFQVVHKLPRVAWVARHAHVGNFLTVFLATGAWLVVLILDFEDGHRQIMVEKVTSAIAASLFMIGDDCRCWLHIYLLVQAAVLITVDVFKALILLFFL